jgi:nascent polypeptide-associated complex subunit alpha
MSMTDKLKANAVPEKKDDEMPELEEQGADDGHTFNRNEKKCRKALMKVGMKQLSGITRVTLKKRDGLIFVIDDPEVLNSENSYAIFGELKLEDQNRQAQMEQAKKFAAQAPAKAVAKPAAAAKDDGEPLPEEGLTPNHISMVMDHANCSRNAAIRVLRETNDDMVQAVMKLTN